jgi:RNA polymerase sigma factor (sigma-70 family)
VYAIASRGYRLTDADAEDVFQEVFARAHQHLHRLRDDTAIQAWIGQLTRRLCVDALRASSRTVLTDEPPDAGAHDTALQGIEQAMDVRRAMAGLPDSCHDVLDRFFARDESYLTIGEALGIPSGTIASRISRCLARLRTRLEGRS